MKTNKLPHFKSADEEAKFWDTHSLADYIDEMKDVTDLFTFSPHLIDKIQKKAKKRMVAIRLAQWEIEKSKEIAKKRHVPYQSLIRHWIDEGLRKEIAA